MSVDDAPRGPVGEVTVRGRRDTDLPACAALLRRVHACDGYPVRLPDPAEPWLRPAGELAAWVAERDGGVLGHVALADPPDGGTAPLSGSPLSGALWVGRLFVSPDARGLGIGAALLTVATGAGHAAGRAVGLDVVSDHTAALALYRRLGWREVGQSRPDWLPEGRYCRLMAAPTVTLTV